MKNLGYMLLVALLLCCTCVQCSEKEHQTPPALSEGDDPGGDGGEENPEGLPGYPKGLTVDEFTQELANGSKCLGFYAIVDFKANPNLRFRPQFSAAKKPTAYFSAFAESGSEARTIIIHASLQRFRFSGYAFTTLCTMHTYRWQRTVEY